MRFKVGDLVKVTERGSYKLPTGVGRIINIGKYMIDVDMIYVIKYNDSNGSFIGKDKLKNLPYIISIGEIESLDGIKDRRLIDRVMAELI